MDFGDLLLYFGLAIGALLVGFCWLSNRLRERCEYKFTLKPNCLLTRHPVVFLTGRRSIFYFRRYWNSYPAFLAEHGYEVFTLALPWKGPERLRQMKAFLEDQEKAGNTFHFVMDQTTSKEFSGLFDQASACLSQTIPALLPTSSSEFTKNRWSPISQWIFKSSFTLHRYFAHTSGRLTAADLGAAFPRGASSLLARMQELGEEDFLRTPMR